MKFSQTNEVLFKKKKKNKGILKALVQCLQAQGIATGTERQQSPCPGPTLTAPRLILNIAGQHSKHPIHLKLALDVLCLPASRLQQLHIAHFNMTFGALKGRGTPPLLPHQGLVSILNLQGYQRKIMMMMTIKMERGMILPTLPRNVFPLKEFYFNICVVQHT